MKKIGRNDPCHCGSGKKFKKCCESSMIGGRFVATQILSTPSTPSLSSPQMTISPKMTGLFHSRVAPIPQTSENTKPISVTSAPEIEKNKISLE